MKVIYVNDPNNNIVSIEKWVSINLYSEKIEIRKYKSGHERAYIFQGKRWYITEVSAIREEILRGIIIEEPETAAQWSRIVALGRLNNLSN